MSGTTSEATGDRALAESIAVATRSVHAKLNKLIVARLPWALPPRAADPAAYISGLLHIAPIYITFEALWHDILDNPPTSEASSPTVQVQTSSDQPLNVDKAQPPPSQPQPEIPVSSRMHSILEHLYLPGLMRADRLRGDIKALTGWSDHAVDFELTAISRMGRLGDFVEHIKRAVKHRPHVLLAYSYILFMALFAGGRFIRATLESVGSDFWDSVPSPIKPTLHACQRDTQKKSEPASGLSEKEIPEDDFNSHGSHTMPLRFFHFPTAMDGEDLKREFKQHLKDSEELLTPQERQEIVQEAVCIFDNMTLVVQQLDAVCDDPNRKEEDHAPLDDLDLASYLKNPLKARLRDSVAVAKERSARSSRISSSSSEDSTCACTKQRLPGCSARNCLFNHPELADMSLCPGLSKSMRFQKQLPRPTFHGEMGGHVPTLHDKLKVAVKRSRGTQLVNWLIMFGLGAVVFGVFVSARKHLGHA